MKKLFKITILLFSVPFAIPFYQDTLTDLQYMHTTLLNNHPGVHNDEDPDFIKHLDNSFIESFKKIKNASDANECNSILIDFAKSFNDSHLRLSLHNCSEKNSMHDLISRKNFYTINLKENIQWITLPTFSPNDPEQKILNDIIENLPTIRSYKTIIFDLRGNGGGNSYWGKLIVEKLFGQTYAKKMIENANKNVYVEWRASKDNIAFLKNLYMSFQKDFGIDGPATQWLNTVIQDLQQAYDQGLPLCRSKKIVNNANVTFEDPSIYNPVRAKIIIIIDQKCASACLDFIDYLKAMNHDIVLFGETTGADSVYMEIQEVNLPSKKGTFCFPMKVYRNRIRGNNVPYYPDISYNGNINDTTHLKDVILKYCECE
jgi:hypothetical protein